MKLAVIALCFAAAAAAAPPRIELNLGDVGVLSELSSPVLGDHFNGVDEDNPNPKINSALRYNLTCEITDQYQLDAAPSCKLPTAKAFDHYQQNVTQDIKVTVWRLDNDNDVAPTRMCSKLLKDVDWQEECIDWEKRSETLIYYDVDDKNGNHAEQVVLRLNLVDTTKPQFEEREEGVYNCTIDPVEGVATSYGNSDGKIEAADACEIRDSQGACTSYWNQVDGTRADFRLCHLQVTDNAAAEAEDAITSRIRYTIVAPDGRVVKTSVTHSEAADALTTSALYSASEPFPTLGVFNVTARVADEAGIYGSPCDSCSGGAEDNEQTIEFQVHFVDRTKPIITDQAPDNNPYDYHCDNPRATKDYITEASYDPNTGAESREPYNFDYEVTKFGPFPISVTDERDDITGNACNDASCLSATFSHNVNTTVVGAYTVEYNRDDTSSDPGVNHAVAVTRTVNVVDRTPPQVFIQGLKDGDSYDHPTNHSANAENLWQESMAYCADECTDMPQYADMTWHQCGDPCDGGDQCKGIGTEAECTGAGGCTWFGFEVNATRCTDDRDGIDNTSPGTYIRNYTCTDGQGNSVTAQRTIHIIDETDPTITIRGAPQDETMVYEATHISDPKYLKQEGATTADVRNTYEDQGATCEDFSGMFDGLPHDQNLSERIVTTVMRVDDGTGVESEAPVDLTAPGTWHIHYDCEDLHGNHAARKTRTIIVQDTRCPYIKLNATRQLFFVEAGLEFTDEGPDLAFDSLDGDGLAVTTDGNTMGDEAFVSQDTRHKLWGSCAAIQADVWAGLKSTSTHSGMSSAEHKHNKLITRSTGTRPAHNGDYQIKVNDEELKVYCDFSTATASTWYRVDECQDSATCSPTVVAYGADQGSCAAMGLRMPTWAEVQASDVASLWPQYFRDPSENKPSTRYVCTTSNDGAAPDSTVSSKAHVSAEAGQYVITYTTTDNAGNGNRDAACLQRKHNTCTATNECTCDVSDANFSETDLEGKSEEDRKYRGCGNLEHEVKRTIVVKDTLPPIITLFGSEDQVLNQAQIDATSDENSNAKGHTWDVTYVAPTNKFSKATTHTDAAGSSGLMMAEVPVFGASANWALASVAAAVVGIALLTAARGRRDVLVPV